MWRYGWLMLLGGWLSGAGAGELALPPGLQAWVPWVLHRAELCPYLFNARQAQCQWASELHLEIQPGQGRFSQDWQLYHEGWLLLPGDVQSWPRAVQVNGVAGLVVAHQGRPALWLPAGRHAVQGEFVWTRRPEQLPLPSPVGLVHLRLDGVLRPAELDAEGRLWLRDTRQAPVTEADRLELQVFRQIHDTIPLQMQVWLELEVAGRARELTLGPVVAADYLPLALDSPLPVRLEAGQLLRVQVRPGRWRIALTFRHAGGSVTAVARPQAPEPWPETELWVFAAQPQLRTVEVTGAPAIDPQQTLLPAAWRTLPAYRLEPGMQLRLSPQPAGATAQTPTALTLGRELWLDFAGTGYSFRDTWGGYLATAARLELTAPGARLGRVTLAGQPQLITQLPTAATPGVELRRGDLKLSAEGRLETDRSALPALGWNQAAQQLSWELHLPPGWRLLTAWGPDQVPGTWLARWTMWHWFGVLLVAVGLARLWSWPWGILALVTLTLIYHEPHAPHLSWLAVLLGLALRAVVPVTMPRVRLAVQFYVWGALGVLLLLALPFGVQQMRQALYPQLAHPQTTLWSGAINARTPAWEDAALTTAVPASPVVDALPLAEEASPGAGFSPDPADLDQASAQPQQRAYARAQQTYAKKQAAPALALPADARVQTGFGLPTEGQWQHLGQRVALNWTGPVQADEQVHLVLLTPRQARGLYLAQVTLLALLLLALVRSVVGTVRPMSPAPVTLLLACVVLGGGGPHGAQAAESDGTMQPTPELLAELRQRLLEAPRCLPDCASVAHLGLEAQPERLQLNLQINVLETVAVPLPGGVGRWIPARVRLGDNVPLLMRREGQLWALLPAGQHTLQMEGPLPAQRSVQLPLPLLPQVTEVRVQGWQVEGVRENQRAEPVLELVREADAATTQFAALEPSNLPAFVQVERHLQLGLDWRLTTTVRRQSPPGAAILLRIPLLPGEAVISEHLNVVQGLAQVQLAADAAQLSWESTLTPTETLTLTALETESWRETWRLDAGSLWHVALSGLPATHDPGHDWVWQPQPGEQLHLQISRPAAVPGAVLTLESGSLDLAPGQRATDATLKLRIRSSLGTQHRLQLPPQAQLRELRVNDRKQPLRQEATTVVVPISPGVQSVVVQWQQPESLGQHYQTPRLDLGAPLVNAEIRLQVPEDRWVLWTQGPLVGPVVLFWGLLGVLALLALGLGRWVPAPLGGLSWFLLLVVLSALNWLAVAVVVIWLLTLGVRPGIAAWQRAWAFNLAQVGLVALSFLALLTLLVAVKSALLDGPEMHIVGNGSSGHLLRWYQDRAGPEFAQASVFSLPLWGYRLLTLLWALWLSLALLHWLRWGWQQAAAGGLWRQAPARLRNRTLPKPVSEQEGVDE